MKLTFDIGAFGSQASNAPTLAMVALILRKMWTGFPSFVRASFYGAMLFLVATIAADVIAYQFHDATITGADYSKWPKEVTFEGPVVAIELRVQVAAAVAATIAVTVLGMWMVLAIQDRWRRLAVNSGKVAFVYPVNPMSFALLRTCNNSWISEQELQLSTGKTYRWDDLLSVRVCAKSQGRPVGVFILRFASEEVVLDTSLMLVRQRRPLVEFVLSFLKPLELHCNSTNLGIEQVQQSRLKVDLGQYPPSRVFSFSNISISLFLLALPLSFLFWEPFRADLFKNEDGLLALIILESLLATVVGLILLTAWGTRKWQFAAHEKMQLSVLACCPFCDKQLVAKDGGIYDFTFHESQNVGRRTVRYKSGSMPRCRKCYDVHSSCSWIQGTGFLISFACFLFTLILVVNGRIGQIPTYYALGGSAAIALVAYLLSWWRQRSAGIKSTTWARSQFFI
ncbi:MAG: hypothetical protein R3C18_14135 [Planctomycetaceae bacterium]